MMVLVVIVLLMMMTICTVLDCRKVITLEASRLMPLLSGVWSLMKSNVSFKPNLKTVSEGLLSVLGSAGSSDRN